jgi:hypothetical protein
MLKKSGEKIVITMVVAAFVFLKADPAQFAKKVLFIVAQNHAS